MIAILDLKLGNSGSLKNMLTRIGVDSVITHEPDEVLRATKLILPGVGSFDVGMERLASSGLLPALEECVMARGVPILGICLGMQMLGLDSEEGSRKGLGWISAHTRRIRPDPSTPALRLPHMGWNTVMALPGSTWLHFAGTSPRFYFVHSYHVVCDDPADRAGLTEYGQQFTSAVKRGNIMGVQFHPEKSHRWGMQLLSRFSA